MYIHITTCYSTLNRHLYCFQLGAITNILLWINSLCIIWCTKLCISLGYILQSGIAWSWIMCIYSVSSYCQTVSLGVCTNLDSMERIYHLLYTFHLLGFYFLSYICEYYFNGLIYLSLLLFIDILYLIMGFWIAFKIFCFLFCVCSI